MCLFVFFFFQAEDGIRDLVRSRGLGDVYKRQTLSIVTMDWKELSRPGQQAMQRLYGGGSLRDCEPVSYTHLTLPTSDLV